MAQGVVGQGAVASAVSTATSPGASDGAASATSVPVSAASCTTVPASRTAASSSPSNPPVVHPHVAIAQTSTAPRRCERGEVWRSGMRVRQDTTRPRAATADIPYAPPQMYPELTSLAVAPSGDLWIAGSGGLVRRWDGACWTVERIDDGVALDAVWAAGDDDVWVGGHRTIGPPRPGLFRRRGGAWTPYEALEVRAIWGASATEAWATGWGPGELLAWDGERWSRWAGVEARVPAAVRCRARRRVGRRRGRRRWVRPPLGRTELAARGLRADRSVRRHRLGARR